MGQGLGIAALVLLVLSVPIPVYGTYINFVALAIAAASALSGNKVFPISVIAVSAVKLFMMSPTWMLIMATSGRSWAPGFTWFMLAVPAAAVLLRYMMDSGSLPAAGGLANALGSTSLGEPILNPRPAAAPPPPPAAPPGSDMSFWDGMADKNDPDLLQEYLIRFPDGRFAELAQVKLERLGVAPPSGAPATAAAPASTPEVRVLPEPAICAACAMPFESDAGFCTGCGAPRGAASPA